MAYEPQFDDMMFAMLNHVGSIEKFLDQTFSFLFRRTDFFKIKRSGSDKLGLPPGIAEKTVKAMCKKYVQLEEKISGAKLAMSNLSEAKVHKEATKTSERKEQKEQENKQVKEEKKEQGNQLVKEEEKEQENKQVKEEKSEQENMQVKEEEKELEDKQVKEEKKEQENKQVKEGKKENLQEEEPKLQQKDSRGITEIDKLQDSKQSTTPHPDETPESDANKNEETERKYYTANPECYNGATYDKYCWTQSINDLDVQVKAPADVTKGKQVQVHMDYTHLKVEALIGTEWKVLLDGDLLYRVQKTSTSWSFDPSARIIFVHVDKDYERYWEALLEGEPKIDVRAIDCSKPYEDLDEEAQAKLEEMMYDQHQKMLGKPTSKEAKIQELMKQAWDKKDSPFKGQKFDPSLFNVS